ncbi:hypothetical protein PR202_gb05712 [Eleusine coracana subsp. coracana]|uniref:SHSP domain-containing protein n=1 Tax=Eleusine coracana subsp. coracana TaxID=191504 RepID=A0AAV5E7Q6_ELECO|nr:hypothetical protein QOZ80_1BG0072450 [Eleusine coracana subsp. coracana]GJN18540.1 hypothetical protein PR202_gb05712 [Eleusine coracana subsp. coracana]
MASRLQAPSAAEQPAGDLDPVYEWLDDGGSYLLRLNLAGFNKEDFRVHVDAGGRLTVISQQGRAPRLHKAFQLPNTANLDGITGRFDGAVLTLTVPKQQQPDAVAPTQTKEKEAAAGEPKHLQEDKTPAPKVAHAEAKETDRRVEAEKASLMTRGKDENDKRKAEATPPVPSEKEANGSRRDDQEEKATSADHRAYVAREAARRIEAAGAKVAEARAAAERTGGQWKERAAAEGLKWAETIGQKKEVIATAVAAFTLGVFVSQTFGRR